MEHRQWCPTKEGCPIKSWLSKLLPKLGYKSEHRQLFTLEWYALIPGTRFSVAYFIGARYMLIGLQGYLAPINGNGSDRPTYTPWYKPG